MTDIWPNKADKKAYDKSLKSKRKIMSKYRKKWQEGLDKWKKDREDIRQMMIAKRKKIDGQIRKSRWFG